MRLSKAERLLAIAQPFALALAAIFSAATDIVTSPESLVRPALVATVFCIVTLLVSLAIFRNLLVATIFASAFVAFSFRQTVLGTVLFGVGIWWLAIQLIRSRTGRQAASPSLVRFVVRAVGVFSIAVLAVSAWGLFTSYSNGRPTLAYPEYQAIGRGGPNVYVLMLDGYPRADTLSETFDFDNGQFLRDLERRGFQVSPKAQSNYSKTWLTFASMLNGTYVDRLLGDKVPPSNSSLQYRWLDAMIQHASLLDVFRERGYRVETIPVPFDSVAIRSADAVLNRGRLTEIEARLLAVSPWAHLFRSQLAGWMGSNQEHTVLEALDTSAAIASSEAPQPTFLFAHVHSPHTPFVLHPPGTPARPAPECQPIWCLPWNATIEELQITEEDFAAGLRPQIEELNSLVLETADSIVTSDPNSIVILMSDHGIRYSLEDLDEHYRTFLAAYTPDGTRIFEPDESPVNILRGVLSHLGEELPPLPYERWESNWSLNLDMRPATSSQ